MVVLKEILPDQLWYYVNIAFEHDDELIEKYHLVNGNLVQCVVSTLNEIFSVAQGPHPTALFYYAVEYRGHPVGFTVFADKCLLSFGIGKWYRRKEIVQVWWDLVCAYLGHEFVTWLFRKNTRAIEFLQRNNMRIVESESTDRYVGLVYLKEEGEPVKLN